MQMGLALSMSFASVEVSALSAEERSEVLKLAEKVATYSLTNKVRLNSPKETGRYLRAYLAGRDAEVFVVVFLDSQHQIIATEEMFQGTLDSCSIHPREVVKAALRHNAAAVVFSHNHPSGLVEESGADKQITRRLVSALDLIEVRVLDHFIVGGGTGELLSFAEKGLL